MINAGPMGPGFFIFFQETQIEAGSGHPAGLTDELYNAVIIYESLPVKTVKKLVKKVRKYKEAKKELNPENINAIVESMVDTWPKQEMTQSMDEYQLDEELAILSYKATLSQFIFEDDLALILILASS